MISKELLNKVSDITKTDYSSETILKNLVEAIIEDLLLEIVSLNDELRNTKSFYEDNYERINPEKMI